MFHNNIVEISEKKIHKRNLSKIYLKVTYATDFCIFCIHFFYYGNVELFDCFFF